MCGIFGLLHVVVIKGYMSLNVFLANLSVAGMSALSLLVFYANKHQFCN